MYIDLPAVALLPRGAEPGASPSEERASLAKHQPSGLHVREWLSFREAPTPRASPGEKSQWLAFLVRGGFSR
jgi:hypothetical protein